MLIAQIIGVCVSLSALLLNVILMGAYMKVKALYSDRSNKHVMCVLVAHVFINTGLIYYGIEAKNASKRPVISVSILTYGIQASYATMVTLSIDRYICILHPFRYLKMTKVWRHLLLAFPWFYAAAITVVRVAHFKLTIVVFATLGVTVLFLVATNARVFLAAVRQRNAIMRAAHGNQLSDDAKKKIKDVRLAYACFGAVVTLLTLTLPIEIYVVNGTDHMIRMVLVAVANLNSFCDPVCFLIFNKTARRS